MPQLVLVNGPPGSGKSTLARRYAAEHDRAALVEFDELRMMLPNWQRDEATRLAARDLAGAAIVEHLTARRDVIVPQFFGRLGFIVVLQGLAREHDAEFIEVVLEIDAAVAIERFRLRRQKLREHGEHHPEGDISDADIEAFIIDSVGRLARLPTARPVTRIVPVAREASADQVYELFLSVLGGTTPQP